MPMATIQKKASTSTPSRQMPSGGSGSSGGRELPPPSGGGYVPPPPPPSPQPSSYATPDPYAPTYGSGPRQEYYGDPNERSVHTAGSSRGQQSGFRPPSQPTSYAPEVPAEEYARRDAITAQRAAETMSKMQAQSGYESTFGGMDMSDAALRKMQREDPQRWAEFKRMRDVAKFDLPEDWNPDRNSGGWPVPKSSNGEYWHRPPGAQGPNDPGLRGPTPPNVASGGMPPSRPMGGNVYNPEAGGNPYVTTGGDTGMYGGGPPPMPNRQYGGTYMGGGAGVGGTGYGGYNPGTQSGPYAPGQSKSGGGQSPYAYDGGRGNPYASTGGDTGMYGGGMGGGDPYGMMDPGMAMQAQMMREMQQNPYGGGSPYGGGMQSMMDMYGGGMGGGNPYASMSSSPYGGGMEMSSPMSSPMNPYMMGRGDYGSAGGYGGGYSGGFDALSPMMDFYGGGYGGGYNGGFAPFSGGGYNPYQQSYGYGW